MTDNLSLDFPISRARTHREGNPSDLHNEAALFMETWIESSVHNFLKCRHDTKHLLGLITRSGPSSMVLRHSTGQRVKEADGGLRYQISESTKVQLCIVEVGISERSTKLQQDMLTWFAQGVKVVLLVNIKETKLYKSPAKTEHYKFGDFDHESNYAKRIFSKVLKREPLGEYKYKGHTWFNAISQMSVQICKIIPGKSDPDITTINIIDNCDRTMNGSHMVSLSINELAPIRELRMLRAAEQEVTLNSDDFVDTVTLAVKKTALNRLQLYLKSR
ncbi:hypothetical protein V1505DRAFT_410048 [Lipomyces doorenjongii]